MTPDSSTSRSARPARPCGPALHSRLVLALALMLASANAATQTSMAPSAPSSSAGADAGPAGQTGHTGQPAPAPQAPPATSSPSTTPAAPAGPMGLQIDPAQLLAGTPTSGAITMLPGETYHGPGPITVGYLGAKKQLVLPNGPWVLLAVADRPSQHATPVALVSMAFGQFREGRLVTLLSFLFNGRNAPVRTWPEVEDCHAQKLPRGAVHEPGETRGGARVCGWTVRSTTPPNVSDPAWEQAQAVVARLGAAVPPPPLHLTRAWATDRLGNYLGLRRVDYAAAAGTTRAGWLHEYLPFLLEGLDKKIPVTELEPNDPRPPRLRLTLPD